VRYDPEKLKSLGVVPHRRSLINPAVSVHHDPFKLAKVIMLWFLRKRRKKPINRQPPARPPLPPPREQTKDEGTAATTAPAVQESADVPVRRYKAVSPVVRVTQTLASVFKRSSQYPGAPRRDGI
jgi:hypothetical protein